MAVKRSKIKKAVILRFGAIGDLILVSHFIRNFKCQYPEVQLDMVIKSSYVSLYENHPLIHRIFPLEKNNLKEILQTVKINHYDVIFDFQGNSKSRLICLMSPRARVYRTKMYRWQRFLLVKWGINLYPGIVTIPERHLRAAHPLQIKDDAQGLDLYLNDQIQSQFNAALGKKKIIAVAPGASRKTKQWPEGYFKTLIDMLVKENVGIVLLGGKTEYNLCENLKNFHPESIENQAGALSLLETASCLKSTRLLVCNDTGLLHMGSALHRPVVALFGPTTREFGFYPDSPQVIIMENKEITCRPCSYHGTQQCPEGHFNCLKTIKPSLVFEQIKPFLRDD